MLITITRWLVGCLTSHSTRYRLFRGPLNQLASRSGLNPTRLPEPPYHVTIKQRPFLRYEMILFLLEVLLNVGRVNVRRHFFSPNELPLYGIVYHLLLLILEVCHHSRVLLIMLILFIIYTVLMFCAVR